MMTYEKYIAHLDEVAKERPLGGVCKGIRDAYHENKRQADFMALAKEEMDDLKDELENCEECGETCSVGNCYTVFCIKCWNKLVEKIIVAKAENKRLEAENRALHRDIQKMNEMLAATTPKAKEAEDGKV